jgi:hypothetical protein
LTLTNVDLELFLEHYDVKNLTYNCGFKFRQVKGMFKKYIDFWINEKITGQKEGSVARRTIAKLMLNSLYGKFGTNGLFRSKRPDIKADKSVGYKLNKSEIKDTIYCPVASFITSYARADIIRNSQSVRDYTLATYGEDYYIYSDTDSIKCVNIRDHMDYIKAYNRQCELKLRHMCDYYGIDYSELLPKTIKGIEKPLGVWDWETKDNIYKKFKTLGAKRYMVYQGDELSITVSGVNKKQAVPYLREQYTIDDCFENFNDGLVIPEEFTGKLTHYYIDKEYKGTITDYKGVSYDYDEKSGIYLEPAAYCFDISLEYIEFLKGFYYTKL